jgi:hypothetical protein
MEVVTGRDASTLFQLGNIVFYFKVLTNRFSQTCVNRCVDGSRGAGTDIVL